MHSSDTTLNQADALAQLAAIVDSSSEAIIGKTLDGRITTWNTAAEKIFGYTADEARSLPPAALLPPDRLEEETVIFDSIQRGEHARRYETVRVRKDGRLLDMSIAMSPIKDASGNVIGVSMLGHDISDTKSIAAKLQRIEDIYRKAISAVGGVPYLYDYGTRTYTFMGGGIQSLTGYRPDEMTPDFWLELAKDSVMLGEAEGMTKAEAIRRAIIGEIRCWRCDSRIVTRDGFTRWISDTAMPNFDESGLLIGSVGILEDITGRKQFEQALRASEDHYRLLFENSPTPIYVLDRESLAFLAANQAALKHYGYSQKELLAMTFRDVALLEEVPSFLERLSRLPDQAGNAGVWRHRKKDGRLCEMEITSHLLSFGGKQAWLVLAIDVTERLSLEAQLRQSQKMESVGQLAGGIAHDFNNLLTVINGHAGLLLAKEKLPPNIADPIKEISGAAKRAADLTRQLLTFSRKQTILLQVVDLNEAVNNVTKMLQRILGEDIKLETHFSPELPCVKADLGMIEQVLMNLAVNSRDAMPRGGQLRINTFAVVVDEHWARRNTEATAGNFICMSFADSGCGISRENLSRIFEPFFTTKALDRGTGLGLATVYGIIKQHQGWIEVTSEVGRGTTFDIFFPATKERGGVASMSSGEVRVIGGTETILVVEDEAMLVKLIRHILESHGYKVLECATGAAALKIWEQHQKKIDLLFTDMVLPDSMTGPELAEKLKASKSSLKVLYTSGYDTEKLRQTIDLQEGRNFIQKPFHARKLAELIHDCLNRPV